jgi:sterol 24-C-methyltransferase
MVWGLEKLKIAPPGTYQVAKLLSMAGEQLVEGGRNNLFTPMFFFLARKPE